MKKDLQTKNVGKEVADALVGATLDLAAGIALAPELGKQFYADIKKKSTEFRTSLMTGPGKAKVVRKKAV
jgi:gas vesicle protein